MGFRLPRGTREYFKDVNEPSFKLLFHPYYLCLMVGLDRRAFQPDRRELEDAEFVEEYPQQYYERRELIAALLVEAQLDRKGIRAADRQSIQDVMLELLDYQNSTLLSRQGQQYLDQYAAGGLRLIDDCIPRPSELEAFLVRYYEEFFAGQDQTATSA